MIVYKDKIQIIEYPLFRRRKGTFLARLIGVNIGLDPDGDVFIEPLYMPTLEWDFQENILFITINLNKPGLVVMLYKKFPFITIIPKASLQLEEDARD